MINELLQQPLAASRQLVMLDDVTINRILTDTASALLSHQTKVLTANAEDLQRMDPANPKYDRLKLTEERLAGIAGDMKNVASLPSPLGKQNDRSLRRDRCHLRSTPERHLRCFFSLPQKWECLRTEGRFRC